MKKSWEKQENLRLLYYINKVAHGDGRIRWNMLPTMRGRTKKAMQNQWHRELKSNYTWTGQKYIDNSIAKDTFTDVPRKRQNCKQIKQVRTWLWGLYKIETYD